MFASERHRSGMTVGRWLVASLAITCGLFAACAETTDRSKTVEETSTASEQTHETSKQAQGASTHRWVAGGAGGQIAFVSGDGEANSVVGRVANDGEGVEHAALGQNGWLTAGSSGQTQLLDSAGTPLSEPRTALQGNEVEFVATRGSNWLVGGGSGRIQRVNSDGQPTSDEAQPFPNSVITAGASDMSSNWLVGSADGQLTTFSHNDLQSSGSDFTLANNAEVVEIVWAESEGRWYVFTPAGFTPYSVGTGPSVPSDFEISSTVSAAASTSSRIAVGRSDGRILISTPGTLGSASWSNVLDGSAIREITHNGTNWLVVGEDGKAARVDNSGSVVGTVATVPGGRALTSARPLSSGWMVGIADISVVRTLGSDLTGTTGGPDRLNGSQINTLVPGPESVLIAGEGTSYRLLNKDGSPAGSVQTIDALTGDITTGAWNGRNYFVGTSSGDIARITTDGGVMDTLQVLDGKGIVDMAFSGSFWLVASADGTIRRLRPSGTPYLESRSVGLDTVNAVGFNGDYWLLVGAYQGSAGYLGFNTEGDTNISATSIPETSMLHSVEWGGREWLVGGVDGVAYRIGQGGNVIRQGEGSGPRDVFYNATIRGINFNGSNYLLVGDYGLVRRIQFSTLPYGPGVVISKFNQLNAVGWTLPRGFPGGNCISADSCLEGHCVGSVSDGVCCHDPCDGPCESCFQAITGEPDGTCANIPEGEEPPTRKQNQGIDCITESEETCGQTGLCDGSGNCELYGSEVQCRSKSCQSTQNGAQILPAAFCDGQGNCPSGTPMECDPYASCQESEPACVNTCDSDEDCIQGFLCQAPEGGGMRQCVDPAEQNGNGGNGGGGSSDSGCSTVGQPISPLPAIGLVLAVLGWRCRRRRLAG